jgi:quercetin dioxygenase-like cupin family protein
MITLTRRDLGILAAIAAASSTSYAQNAPYGGEGVKLNILVDQDLPGFPSQNTRLTLVELASGSSIPRHHHPAAQEIVFGLDGMLTVDVDGQGTKLIKAGDVVLLPAGLIHFPRAEGTNAKVIAIHSITDKSKPFRVDVKA